MTTKLTIVAHIKAKADQVDFMKSEMKLLIGATRAEDGCLQYDLHQDNEDPSKFLMFENWKSMECWQAHNESAHLKKFVEVTTDALENLTVQQMTHID